MKRQKKKCWVLYSSLPQNILEEQTFLVFFLWIKNRKKSSYVHLGTIPKKYHLRPFEFWIFVLALKSLVFLFYHIWLSVLFESHSGPVFSTVVFVFNLNIKKYPVAIFPLLSLSSTLNGSEYKCGCRMLKCNPPHT